MDILQMFADYWYIFLIFMGISIFAKSLGASEAKKKNDKSE